MSLFENLKSARPFFVIAGPCVVESEAVMHQCAERLSQVCRRLELPLIFKSSYKKANRSSGDSYTGPGILEGLKLLHNIGRDYNLPILSDVHEVCEVASAAEVCDILQIPAFLSRQTDLIRAAALSGRIVNIKKGQFMAPEDMQSAAQKASETGNEKILLTERGSSFGYHNLVVDFRGFAIMKEFGYPIIYDLTHSLQLPSIGKRSGGNPEFAPMMAKAALATGKVDGLFIECHPDPAKGLSDASTMLALDSMENLLRDCVRICEKL
ncbi:MAG: 3-deoxy-8-phosphooctulonate synthase [Candidatus Cloacimonetes bacterium]|jgi:2-dehydro-3-deoxyphosphooctonate aldolase (KDO 8-P synthase)|nr:3-deoxy-8-phosphooctulonate synthase [Candidatus Cloacimonadota bacterium]MDD2505711.1 3-deoxy-8-phosphooctulonate synthase [Candidatus Cloacimonadota bacterium]MDD4559133.1 3-deoxy-8-phosphooctulonate synthase [Candidatus Cloacimonadota bacterium]